MVVSGALNFQSCYSGRIGGLESEVEKLQEEITKLKTQQDELKERTDVLEQTDERLSNRILAERNRTDILMKKLISLTGTEAIGSVDEGELRGGASSDRTRIEVEASPAVTEESIFGRAMSNLKAKKYSQAIIGFEELTALYPESDVVPEARYRVGEAYYQQGDYYRAVEVMTNLATSYPESPFTPEAYLLTARSHHELGNDDKASEILEYLMSEYQDTETASVAENFLKSISGKEEQNEDASKP